MSHHTGLRYVTPSCFNGYMGATANHKEFPMQICYDLPDMIADVYDGDYDEIVADWTRLARKLGHVVVQVPYLAPSKWGHCVGRVLVDDERFVDLKINYDHEVVTPILVSDD